MFNHPTHSTKGQNLREVISATHRLTSCIDLSDENHSHIPIWETSRGGSPLTPTSCCSLIQWWCSSGQIIEAQQRFDHISKERLARCAKHKMHRFRSPLCCVGMSFTSTQKRVQTSVYSTRSQKCSQTAFSLLCFCWRALHNHTERLRGIN